MFEYGLEAFLKDPTMHGRVGLITNHTGRDRHGVHLADRLLPHPHLMLTRIFSPEHGFGSDAPDGEPVGNSLFKQHVPIVSLYGTKKAPDAEDLQDIDLLVFDIQDVGVRFYTYISTLRNVLEAAATHGIPVHILDRPNLLGGTIIEGPMLTPGYESFVGHLPIPLRYGLTPAELAGWWNQTLPRPAPLVPWKCSGYHRSSSFSQLGIPWCKPSPSMATPETAKFYPGTCLFEGTNVSEGRGSDAPFQILGAPWVVPLLWLETLTPLLPDSVTAETVEFTPTFSKFQGEPCSGIKVSTSEPIFPEAVELGIALLHSLMKSHPGMVAFPRLGNRPHLFFDLLAGNSWLREGLEEGLTPGDLFARGQEETRPFADQIESFWLYR